MAYSAVTLPLTGSGDATAAPACDVIGGNAYQAMKLMDGTEGSTIPVPAKGTTPGSTDHGLVVRPIASTVHNQAVVGAVGLTSGSSQVGITSGSSEVALTSVGSTRLVGRVTVENPTTAVSLSSHTGITSGSSEVALTSAGSTRLVGRVDVNNPTTLVTLSSHTGITSGSSEVALTSAGSSRQVGTINQGTPANSSADAWWVRSVTTGSAGGSTTVDANLTSAGSTKLIGVNNYESFTSALTSRTSVASSADIALFAANTNVRCRIIQNQATGFELLLNLSTNVVSSASTGSDIRIPANGYVVFGGQTGNFPLYVGPMRAKLGSTTVTAVAIGTQFLASTT